MSKKQDLPKPEPTESGSASPHHTANAVSSDVSFDNIATKFDKNIYGSTKGKLRHEILNHNLADIWPLLPRDASVLDAGGGTGEFTRELLSHGYCVTLNDVSNDTLEVAKQKLTGMRQVRFHHGAIQTLDEPNGFDLITCHAVFEWLNEPQLVLKHLVNLLRPGGYLSLSFFNHDANVFGNLLYGNFQLVSNNMQQKNRLKLASHKPLKPALVLSWLEGLNLTLVKKAGIRCFHDYLRDKTQQTACYDSLLAMEKQYCAKEPYLWLGKYFHVVVKKPE